MTHLVLVDGFNLLWRAAYGFPARITAPDGRVVTAPFGFFALLRKALRELGHPGECVVVFDGEQGWTERQADFGAYKAARRDLDFSPIDWLGAIETGLTDLGIAWQESGEHEADDVIATLATRAGRRPVVVMSTDRDFHQLLGHLGRALAGCATSDTAAVPPGQSPRGLAARCRPVIDRHSLGPWVVQLNTTRSAARRVITDLEVIDRYRVTPSQWCDYVALVGDRSDGIPGITGIGPIRAAALLADGLSLDDLQESGRLVGAHGRRLHDQLDGARRWRSLVRLRTNVAVAVAVTGRATPELPLAAEMLRRLAIW